MDELSRFSKVYGQLYCNLSGTFGKSGVCEVCNGSNLTDFERISQGLLPPILPPNAPLEVFYNYSISFTHMLNHLPLDEISLSNDFIAQMCLLGLSSADRKIRIQMMYLFHLQLTYKGSDRAAANLGTKE